MKKSVLFLIALSLSTILSSQIVHLDDVIIDGSQCTGTDCVSNESFGFDVHRYKESNLRIHFDDTSPGGGSFPNNDWRIRINDSSNGGANYFAIDDATAEERIFRLDAGAPASSLYVKSNGHLGLGTDNPQQDIHIVSGDYPNLRFDQDTNGGFDAQVWEIGGDEIFFSIRDESSSTIPLQVGHKAPDNSLVIDSLGNIGIGTLSPAFDLQVAGNVDVTGELTAASDIQLKYNIENMTDALETIMELRPVNYLFKCQQFPEMKLSARKKIGLIAQEVEQVLPNLVSNKTKTTDVEGLEHTLKSVNYIELIPLLVKGMQEQQETINQQAERIKVLEGYILNGKT